MRGYRAIVSARFRTLLQYRAAAFAGMVTQLFWGLVLVMIFEAFFRSSTAPQPMELEEVATYIWLGQAFLVLLPWNVDRDIQAMIRSGADVPVIHEEGVSHGHPPSTTRRRTPLERIHRPNATSPTTQANW